jgi:hypothetical protein
MHPYFMLAFKNTTKTISFQPSNAISGLNLAGRNLGNFNKYSGFT